VYGLDFGYSVPTALVKVSFKDKKTFVEEVIYQTKLTTNDLIERMKDLGINGSVEIFCDNAEPKTIEELTRAGFNAKPASKDVYAGIQKVKAQDLYISPGSVNLLKEIRSYRWKVDKDGKVHQNEEPVKMWDHLCDAMRYAIYTKLNKLRFQIMAW
jgi:phage terminase large subunit